MAVATVAIELHAAIKLEIHSQVPKSQNFTHNITKLL